MSNLYAMRRANSDWFTLEDDGKLLVPLFHTTHDAYMARLRIVEMLVFGPVALDFDLLKDITDAETEVGFCLVENPFADLKRAHTLSQAQVISLITFAAPPHRRKWLARPWSNE